MKYIMQDAVDDNLQWKPDVSAQHPLKVVADFVKNKINHADKSREFNLAEKFEELSRPP